ncbi:MAG: glucose-6-phosphate dehydrogenase assembly protein OpcA [Bryobacterales bacterium]|nr:glucose-6-phosphate dehydrogenase assembly protein OpcA [Bryobacterales bacterium]
MMSAVTPEKILKDLAELWTGHGKTDDSGTLRACTMTLLIAADEEEDAGILAEMVMEVMHAHPSRAIVLRIRDGEDEGLDSRVTALCWKPFGRRQQICCEQVELRASEAGLAELPRVALGLIAPDLPVVLVCRSLHLFALRGFDPLLRLAGKVVADSRRARRAVDAMELIANHRAQGYAIDDLAWTAITEWREAIASAFDDPGTRAALPRLGHIRITHGAGKPGSGAFYLGAWLMRGIGMRAGVEFRAGSQPAAVESVELEGDGVHLQFTHRGGALHYRSEGIVCHRAFAVSSEWELVRRELAIQQRDTVFEDVLPGAIALAGG